MGPSLRTIRSGVICDGLVQGSRYIIDTFSDVKYHLFVNYHFYLREAQT